MTDGPNDQHIDDQDIDGQITDTGRPEGEYPGDRGYRGFFLAGVLMLIVAVINPFTTSAIFFVIAGLAMFAHATVGSLNARTRRFALWSRIASEIAPVNGARVLDIGSIDGLGSAALLSTNPTLTVVAFPAASDLQRHETNLARFDTTIAPSVSSAPFDALPLADDSIDVIVSDSSKALLRRKTLDGALGQITRVAGPNARVAIVIAGRASTIRRVLTDAGASDITTERVLGTALTGYRLVRATFPATS